MSIKRYLVYTDGAELHEEEWAEGKYVLHSDHAEDVARLMAELAAERKLVAKLHVVQSGLAAQQSINATLRAEVDALKAEVEKISDAHNSSMGAAQDEIDDLRAQLTRLQSEKSAAVEVLRGLEWFACEPGPTGASGPACPECGGNKDKSAANGGHYESCALAAALSGGAA